jgi:magnesium transporter
MATQGRRKMENQFTRPRRLLFRRARSAPPGQAPGTVRIDRAAPKPTIQLIAYDAERTEEREIEDLGSIQDFRDRFPVVWVNVDGPAGGETICGIGDVFGLHRLALEDVANVAQRSKTEEYDDHLFIVMPTVRPDGPALEQVSIFLGNGFVLTFHESSGDCFGPVRERIRKNRGRVRTQKADYLAYALIDTLVDGHFPAIERCEDRLEGIEDQIWHSPHQETVARIHSLRQEIRMLRRSIQPMQEAIEELLRDSTPFVSGDTQTYLRDCRDHALRLLDHVGTLGEHVSDQMEMYLASASNRMNEIMKVLAIVASVFIPLTFIAGIYGMNFENMPELKWQWGYPGVLLLMAMAACAMWFYFRWKDWF